jgi:hypothetical protein
MHRHAVDGGPRGDVGSRSPVPGVRPPKLEHDDITNEHGRGAVRGWAWRGHARDGRRRGHAHAWRSGGRAPERGRPATHSSPRVRTWRRGEG